jgi:hypothetical protein
MWASRFGEAGYLMEAIHELVHAQQFNRLLRKKNWNLQGAKNEAEYINLFDTLQYDKNEIVAEGLALRRAEKYLGKIPENERLESIKYVKEYRDGLEN